MSFRNIWNNGFNFENFNRRWFILLIFPGIIWFFFQILNSTPSNINKQWYDIHLNDEFNGRVTRKWRDNRSNPVFKISDSTEGFDYEITWRKINVGDSILKQKQNRNLKIIKKDTTIVIDIYEEYKFYDSIYRSEY